MNTIEYTELLKQLDGQIIELKRAEEAKVRKEKLEQEAKLIEHWIEGLSKRKLEIEALGAVPAVDLETKLAELHLRLAEIRISTSSVGVGLTQEDIVELDQIFDAVAFNMANKDLTSKQAWFTIEILACRWKRLVDKAGESMYLAESRFPRIYALIRDWMRGLPEQLWFIEALARDIHGKDWGARIKECERLLSAENDRVAAEHAQQEVQEKALEALIYEERAFSGDPNPENERRLRHALRAAAAFRHLREEVAEIVETHRVFLKHEFSFLWPEEKAPAEPEPKHMSRRDIVARILRRMKSKTLIGACHGPFDMIKKGFPPHQAGEAAEALDLLVKGGVIFLKQSVIGPRASIRSEAMVTADVLIGGGSLQDCPLWRWMNEEVSCSAR